MPAIWPLRHLGLKCVSLIIGLVIWLIVAGGQTVERGLRVPLELEQFPSGLELQGEAPTFVDLRVRGAAGTVSRMLPGDAVAVLDLSGATPGRHLFQLRPDLVRVPFGVEVVQVLPATVAIVFEASDTRIVPVVPVVSGDPAEGYIAGKTMSDPDAVEITGPASSIASVTEAITEAVSVEGARGNVTQTVTIGFADPTVRLKTSGRARVTVQVVPGARERSIEDRPVQFHNLRPGLSARAAPPAVAVVLQGRRGELDAVDADDVTAFVDADGLTAGEYTLTVRADSLSGPAVARAEPATVKVFISRAKR